MFDMKRHLLWESSLRPEGTSFQFSTNVNEECKPKIVEDKTMKFIKNLFLIGIVALGITKSSGALYVTNNLADTNHTILVGSYIVDSIILTTTNDTSTLVRLYDGF